VAWSSFTPSTTTPDSAAIPLICEISAELFAEVGTESVSDVSCVWRAGRLSDLVNTERQISLTQAAQAVGGSTDVDWRGFLTQLQDTLPAGVVITTVNIDSAAPGMAYEQSSTPLEGARVATLNFTATSPSLPDVPTWLDGLRTLDAFVDATPNSVQLDADNSAYRVDITMHVSSKIYSGRYASKETDAQ